MYCVLKGKRSLRETDIEECTMYCVLEGKRSLNITNLKDIRQESKTNYVFKMSK